MLRDMLLFWKLAQRFYFEVWPWQLILRLTSLARVCCYCCCVGDAASPAGRTANESASIIRLCGDQSTSPSKTLRHRSLPVKQKDGGSCSPKSAAEHDETKQPRKLDRKQHPHRRERAGKHHQPRRGRHISAAALSLDLLAGSVGACGHISVSIDWTCIITAEHSHVCEQRP